MNKQKNTFTIKHSLFSWIAMTVLFMGVVCIAATTDTIAAINDSIAKGDMQQLSKYMGPNVEMNILGNSSVYSKTQAMSVLSNFFATYPVKNYNVKQGGSMSENTKFSIGTYISKHNDDSFKIYYVVKRNGTEETITKFTIEKR